MVWVRKLSGKTGKLRSHELYATGNYGFRHLHDALTDTGLRTKENRRYDPRPISIHSLGTMLCDRSSSLPHSNSPTDHATSTTRPLMRPQNA
jgi:hypothetical protein